jgi:hypothetical protein
MKRAILMLGVMGLLFGVSGRANAEFLTLSVYAGSGTSGTPLYSIKGSSQSVNADTTSLNAVLDAHNYGALSFTTLSGTSNNPGVPLGGFVSLSGNVSLHAGGPGDGTPLTITLTEDGFTIPSGGAGLSLVTSATANYNDFSPLLSTQSDYSVFTDNSNPPVTGTTLDLPPTGSGTNTQSGEVTNPLGSFVTPYTLENVLTFSLVGASSTALGSDQFLGTTSVVPAAPLSVPEPASLTLLTTGALSLLGYGWRRRRQSA